MVIEDNHIQILSVKYLIQFTFKLQLKSLEVGGINLQKCFSQKCIQGIKCSHKMRSDWIKKCNINFAT